MNAVDSCAMLRIPIAGMDIRGLLEVLLPALLRGRFAISDVVLDEDDEDGRFVGLLKMLPLDLGAGYNSQGVTSSNCAIVKDKEVIVRDGLTWTELSRTWPSAGAGVNSQGVTSSVGPVAVERGYTGTDSYSRLGKGRLGGEIGGRDDCLGDTGNAGLSLG